jgi:hypothetical protein
MHIDDSRLIARFQGLIIEMLVERLLRERRPELADEPSQTWREVEQRNLRKLSLGCSSFRGGAGLKCGASRATGGLAPVSQRRAPAWPLLADAPSRRGSTLTRGGLGGGGVRGCVTCHFFP